MDNVEEVAALYPMVYEWDIFREQVHVASIYITSIITHAHHKMRNSH